jgi:hypothetical protein
MKNKTFTFYDNTNDTEIFDETKQFLFDNFAEIEGWTSPEDIVDHIVYNEIHEQHRLEWHELQYDLEEMIDGNYFIITGTFGAWDGNKPCGKFITSAEELFISIRHLDYIRFYEENGHFYIDGYHHDGYDHYELKKLTGKGYEYASQNYFAHDKKLHDNIMSCNLFSALPHFSRLVGA